MLTSLIGQTLDALDTPALIVDLDALDRNIAFMADTLRQHGVQWRPHAKAHKSPAVAHRELAGGAIGITCAKVSEAEVYVAAGIRSILIANQIVGEIKTRRLALLAHEADITVAVDHLEQAIGLDRAAVVAGSRPGVVIEIDSGMQRAGVVPGDPAVELARQIAELPHLRFRGVMTWEGHAMTVTDPEQRAATIRQSIETLTATAHAIRATGLPVEIVSCGGTGTFLTTAALQGVTEVQAGGGIFGDALYRTLGVPVEPALSLLATVTSRPTSTRALIDAGRKSIDPTACPPTVTGRDDVAAIGLSAEHGTLTLTAPAETPRIGDRIRLLIGYSDQAIHLHEHLYGVRSDRIETIWPTLGRGRLQ